MPNSAYNSFTTGLSQDDYLPVSPSFLDGNNVDGLDTGYGLKLGPKINKQILTDDVITAIAGEQQLDGAVTAVIAGGLGGKLYRIDGTDLTPAYTLTNGEDILQIICQDGEFYIFFRDNVDANNINIATISDTAVKANNWAAMDEAYYDDVIIVGSSKGHLPYLSISQQEIILGGAYGNVRKVNLIAKTSESFTFPTDIVVGITAQGSVFIVYCRDGNVYMWDGASTLDAGQKYLGARISKIAQKESVDYITTEDGQLYVGAGLSFQRISKPRLSNRLEDNSSYGTILSLNSELDTQNRSMLAVLDDMYMFAPDSVSGLIKYGKIIPGTQDGFHKSICKNYAGTDLDYVYDMFFYERSLQRLYFSYKAGSTYGVDYVDFKSVEKADTGYIVTDVFTGGSTFEKEIKMIKRATSNTSGSNNIKVYYRIDNGSWELIQTINDAVDSIQVGQPMKTASGESFKRYRDRQYKIELNNGNGGDNTPILHEINEIFDIDDKNG